MCIRDRYGIVTPSREVKEDKRLFKIVDMVEKPAVNKAPSDFAVLGRYILTPEIFDILENTEPGVNGEIQLTDAIRELMNHQAMYACDFAGTRYDVGDKYGYVKATIDFALKRADTGQKVRDYIKELAKLYS